MANILIIDDEEMLCSTLARLIIHQGHNVNYVLTLEDGIKELSLKTYDVVFLDVHFPDGNGLETLQKINKTILPSPEVIVITGRGDPEGAELAIKNGAWDYLQKPSAVDNINHLLSRVLQYCEEKKLNKLPENFKSDDIIGSSQEIKDCLFLASKVANSNTNIFITGETGTGKELFAYAIHENSPRTDKNFVVVDCAALPNTLVESELFGYKKGAFTGAAKNKEGLMKQADGGTVFLDEVGELPLSVQKSFLRVLQERRFRPLGAHQEVESNFRLITATNRDLDKMVKNGKFREDLLYRLRAISLEIPPLRKRSEDIIDLTLYFSEKFCEKEGLLIKGFSPEIINILIAYEWPGNVRELFNVLERTLVSAQYDQTIFPKHLPHNIRVHVAQKTFEKNKKTLDNPRKNSDIKRAFPTIEDSRREAIAITEKKYLKDLLRYTNRNVKHSCQIAGLSRSRFYAILKKHSISIAT